MLELGEPMSWLSSPSLVMKNLATYAAGEQTFVMVILSPEISPRGHIRLMLEPLICSVPSVWSPVLVLISMVTDESAEAERLQNFKADQ